MKFKSLILSTLLVSVFTFEACAVPAWVNAAAQDASVAAPIAASLVTIIDPALAPLAAAIDTGFAALAKVLNTYEKSPTATNLDAIQSAFAAVDSQVSQLESAAQIKDPATATEIKSIVDLLTDAITEIAALVPAPVVTAALRAPVKTQGQAKNWKAKDFKRAFNAIAKDDPRLKDKQFHLSLRERL